MNDLIMSGLQLMALGMGVVFLFLGVLIGAVTLISRVIRSFETPAESAADAADAELRQVIQSAVDRYRADHPN